MSDNNNVENESGSGDSSYNNLLLCASFFCSNVDKYFLHINEQMFFIKNIDIVYTF